MKKKKKTKAKWGCYYLTYGANYWLEKKEHQSKCAKREKIHGKLREKKNHTKAGVTFVDFERERKETEKPNNNSKQELWACLCSSVGKYARLSFVGERSARASECSRTSPLAHRNATSSVSWDTFQCVMSV